MILPNAMKQLNSSILSYVLKILTIYIAYFKNLTKNVFSIPNTQ